MITEKKIVLWGCGRNLYNNRNKIKKLGNIRAICDSDSTKWGKDYLGFRCISPYEIKEDDFIVFTILNLNVVNEISKTLSNEYCLLKDALGTIQLQEEKRFMEQHEEDLSYDKEKWNGEMVKYIGLHVPASTCNLQCPYCYIRQNGDFYNPPRLYHSAQFIRWALSQKRLGGQALIGVCGNGETLLCDSIIDVIVELLREGHFLHIVSNGTVTSKIYELITAAGEYTTHLFFKFSFHYGELKRRGLLESFVNNIRYVEEHGASYTIELTTDDNLVNEIESIKNFSMDSFGALPHVTIARDDRKKDKPIYTKMPLNQYYSIWSSFDSSLFDVKWEWFGKHISNCKAGHRSLYIDLETGGVHRCYHQDNVDNIYEFEDKILDYDTIEDSCQFAYCYNNHAYLTLGIDPTIETVSYAAVRDRVKTDGSHWVQREVYDFFSQKLYDQDRHCAEGSSRKVII